MSSPNPKNITWATIVEDQTFNLTDIYGNVQTLSIADLNEVMHAVGRSLIIFGVNMGMCFTVAVVVLLLTKTEKRRTPIFALNMAGLSFQFIRMFMVSVFYNGPDYNLQPYLLGDTVLIPSNAFAPFDIDLIAGMFWYTVITASLILQVLVVFGAERKVRRYLKYALGLLGLATIGFNITSQADAFLGSVSKTGEYSIWFPWVYKTGRILYTVTVGVTSGIFVAKLLYLIRRRKKMGFKGFGPLQVIVIMGAQCLLVPLVFVVADFYVNIDGFVTIGETFLTCSLPLSALWASSEAEKSSIGQVKPSAFGTNCSTVSETRPHSKKSFFSFWPNGKGTSSSVHSELEKGSFSDDGDHIMVQRTLEVVSSDSPAPISRSMPSYRF